MKVFIILKNFIPKTLPNHLGRWNDCNIKHQKIDFSNEDHRQYLNQNLKDYLKKIKSLKIKY